MMKRFARFSLMSVLALCLLTPAAHAGIFGGVSAGQSEFKYSDEEGSIDSNETAYKAFVGGRFFKFVGLELSYVDFGKYSGDFAGDPIETDLAAVEGAVMGIIPLGKRFELFAKAGYFYWYSTWTGEEDDNGSDLTYGIGGAFKFAKIFGIRAEYEVFEVEGVDDLTLASIGFEVRF